MAEERGLLWTETAGSVAWFAMDGCWMLGHRLPAVSLAVPTVVLNVLVLRYATRSWPLALVTGAMAAWACMNVLWMTHDFHFLAWGMTVGKVFLVVGAVLLMGAVAVARGDALRILMHRFRRLRLRPPT